LRLDEIGACSQAVWHGDGADASRKQLICISKDQDTRHRKQRIGQRVRRTAAQGVFQSDPGQRVRRCCARLHVDRFNRRDWDEHVSLLRIPQHSRGVYESSRSARLWGSLTRPQYVSRLKAACGQWTRPVWPPCVATSRRTSCPIFGNECCTRFTDSCPWLTLRMVVHRWNSVRALDGSRSKFRRWAPGATTAENVKLLLSRGLRCQHSSRVSQRNAALTNGSTLFGNALERRPNALPYVADVEL